MQTLLVTGGAGFIGGNFVLQAMADGLRVVNLDKLTYAGNLDTLASLEGNERHVFVQGDIGDRALLDRLLAEHRPDAIVNFAAESHVDRSIVGAADFLMTNAVGVQTLLDACLRAGIPRVLQVSTDEVYGSIDVGAFRETDPLEPSSPYSAAKAGGDLIARAYAVTHGLDVVITRCTNNYGPHQFPEKVIPLFVTNLIDGLPVPLYGDGLNVRDWLHVDDHCRAIALALRHGRAGEIYNISGGVGLSNRELTERLLALLDRDWSSVRPVTDRKGHDRRYAIDDSKIRDELGYAPQVGFDDGLTATVEWYQHNEAWWRPLKDAVR